MPPQKHNIFGFFLYTFVVLSAIAIFINSCCVQCPKCRCWNNKIIFRSKHRRLQPVRFFKNPPEIMQSYRVLQDTHYYILLTVGTGISVSGRFKNELSETQIRTFFVLYLFYFPSQWYVQRELVGMILKSRFGATEPPLSKKSLAVESYGSHRWSMFLFPSKRELMEHITYSGNLNGVQTQPASSSGKDEPPPKKTHVVSIAMFHQLGILGRVVCSMNIVTFQASSVTYSLGVQKVICIGFSIGQVSCFCFALQSCFFCSSSVPFCSFLVLSSILSCSPPSFLFLWKISLHAKLGQNTDW